MWFLFFLLFAIFAAIILFYFLAKRPARLLPRGKLTRSEQIKIQEKTFYIEEVSFTDYHQALHHYFYLIPLFSDRKDLLETKYSYLDWTDTTLRFPDCTLQLVRRVNKILLIKSHEPMSVSAFEQFTKGV